MPSWSEAAAVRSAEPAATLRPRPRPRPPARRPRARRGVAGGIVTIGLVALLLAGVVALNVAVLRLNVRLDQLSEQRSKLRADNAALASQLSSAAASPKIEQLARHRLGLVPADPALTTYVDLGK
jgi:cell division protein FtsL